MKKHGNENAVVRLLKSLFEFGLENAGMFYSKYRAFVSDRDDPENLNRLKLIIPAVSGTQSYEYWAFPIGVYSGQGYGSQVLPQRGDMVWVTFEGGRPEIPLWEHGHPSRGEKTEEELKDKDVYYFQTPKGFRVIINDTKNTIRVETPFESSIQLNESGISVVNGKTKNISLGKLNKSSYKAVLGDQLKDVLGDMSKMNTLMSDALEIASTGGTFMQASPYRGVASQIKALAGGLNDKIGKILSDIVTLE